MSKKVKIIPTIFPSLSIPWSVVCGTVYGIMYWILLLIFPSQLAFASPQDLLVSTGENTKTFNHSQLRQLKSYKQLEIKKKNSANNRTYEVVQIKDLFDEKDWSEIKNIQFQALDGMTVTLDKKRLGNSSKVSQAWLAFSSINKPFPVTKSGVSYGPYYLVWQDPEKSRIKPEEWPFQITRLKALRQSIGELYPLTLPDPKITKRHVYYKGYRIFLKNCFPCHTINKQGPAQFGPDLNFPHSPTEYWQESMLKKYIRNPRSVRHWPQGKMPGFDTEEISEAEINFLIAYLKHMSKSR